MVTVEVVLFMFGQRTSSLGQVSYIYTTDISGSCSIRGCFEDSGRESVL